MCLHLEQPLFPYSPTFGKVQVTMGNHTVNHPILDQHPPFPLERESFAKFRAVLVCKCLNPPPATGTPATGT